MAGSLKSRMERRKQLKLTIQEASSGGSEQPRIQSPELPTRRSNKDKGLEQGGNQEKRARGPEHGSRHTKPRTEEPVGSSTVYRPSQDPPVKPHPDLWFSELLKPDEVPILKTDSVRDPRVAPVVSPPLLLPQDIAWHRNKDPLHLQDYVNSFLAEAHQASLVTKDNLYRAEKAKDEALKAKEEALERAFNLSDINKQLKASADEWKSNSETSEHLWRIAQTELRKMQGELGNYKAEVDLLLQEMRDNRAKAEEDRITAVEAAFDEMTDQILENEQETRRSGWITALKALGGPLDDPRYQQDIPPEEGGGKERTRSPETGVPDAGDLRVEDYLNSGDINPALVEVA